MTSQVKGHQVRVGGVGVRGLGGWVTYLQVCRATSWLGKVHKLLASLF